MPSAPPRQIVRIGPPGNKVCGTRIELLIRSRLAGHGVLRRRERNVVMRRLGALLAMASLGAFALGCEQQEGGQQSGNGTAQQAEEAAKEAEQKAEEAQKTAAEAAGKAKEAQEAAESAQGQPQPQGEAKKQ